MSRVSFYRNYDEKEDIIREYLNNLILDWHMEYDKSGSKSEEEMLGSLFEHFSNNKDFYLLLSQRNLFYLLKEVLKELYGPNQNIQTLVLMWQLIFLMDCSVGLKSGLLEVCKNLQKK